MNETDDLQREKQAGHRQQGDALIVVDYTYDFIAVDGKLTCGLPGQEIETALLTQIRQFMEDHAWVVFAVDVHDPEDPYHPETPLFPPHNLRNTAGRELYGRVGEYYRGLQQRGLPSNVLWLDKTRYSAFAGTDLELKLRTRGVHTLHLAGVCTDICVLHTAVDAYNLGFSIVVHEDSVASFNPAGHTWALEHFRTCLGAHIVS
ncbi:cysteine hydrolase [Alicyclobacillaceae bacterium I2511]|nr:cysteine hydrolase [Alicyclobacillaceae bacterium I2511]